MVKCIKFIKKIIVNTIMIIIPSIILTIIFSYCTEIDNSDFFVTTYGAFFSIIGILYSISVGIILSFPFYRIKDIDIRNEYINDIKRSKEHFTFYFCVSVLNEIIFIFNFGTIKILKNIEFNCGLFGIFNFTVILIYIILNYSGLYNTKIKFDNNYHPLV